MAESRQESTGRRARVRRRGAGSGTVPPCRGKRCGGRSRLAAAGIAAAGLLIWTGLLVFADRPSYGPRKPKPGEPPPAAEEPASPDDTSRTTDTGTAPAGGVPAAGPDLALTDPYPLAETDRSLDAEGARVSRWEIWIALAQTASRLSATAARCAGDDAHSPDITGLDRPTIRAQAALADEGVALASDAIAMAESLVAAGEWPASELVLLRVEQQTMRTYRDALRLRAGPDDGGATAPLSKLPVPEDATDPGIEALNAGVAAYEDEILPALNELAASTEAAHRRGEVGMAEVLRVRLARLRARADHVDQVRRLNDAILSAGHKGAAPPRGAP